MPNVRPARGWCGSRGCWWPGCWVACPSAGLICRT